MAGDWSVVFRPAPRRILGALLAGSRSLTELAEATGLRKSSLQPHLKELTSLGVIHRDSVATTMGREVRYHLRNASIHLELDAVTSTAVAWATPGYVDWRFPLTGQVPQEAVRDEVTLFLRHLAPRLSTPDPATDRWARTFVILYGSAARGEATWKSDLDLLVLLPERYSKGLESDVDDVVGWVQETGPHALAVSLAEARTFAKSERKLDGEISTEGIVVWGPRPTEGEEVSRAVWARMKRYKGIST